MLNEQILKHIQATKKSLEAIGSKGEKLRLGRSRSVVISSKGHNEALTNFNGLAVGTEKNGSTPIYFPKFIKGKGFTCTCVDHERLLSGQREKGEHTGDNFDVSACKHVLALGRLAWIHLNNLEKSFALLQGVAKSLDCDGSENNGECESGVDDSAKFVGESTELSTGLSIEKEILWGSPKEINFNDCVA